MMEIEAVVDTVIVSDMHLSEAAVVDPKRPLWMAYKRREFFVDEDFAKLLDHVEAEAEGPVELVLNGDIFDFDSVTQLPQRGARSVDWLARLRGLASEEWMSLFKIERIIDDHPGWFERLGAFLRRGHRAIFVIGNHDVELYWPSVQRRIREAIGLPSRSVPPVPTPEQWVTYAGLAEDPSHPGQESVPPDAEVPLASAPDSSPNLRPSTAPAAQGSGEDEPGRAPESLGRAEPIAFCSWFYLSEADTYISHGHQYDPFCVVKSPINPLISTRGKPQVRVPFGDLACRYLLNGMGYFNPHATENFIMSAGQYGRFFFRYMLRTQPLLIWTWFWGSVATFVIALWSHLRPAMRDPLLVDEKVQAIAWRSGATPSMVRKLNALSVSSASANPFVVLRELWLDRGLLLLALLYGAWQIVLHINIAMPISPLWVFVPVVLFLPPYVLYAASVRPGTFSHPLLTPRRAELLAAITGARRVVFGHTHKPEQCELGPVRYFNCGSWSPAFAEPECIHRIGTQTFVWIRPIEGDTKRAAALHEWPPGSSAPQAYHPPNGGQACQAAQSAAPTPNATPDRG